MSQTPQFTIATLVTDAKQYAAMKASFVAHGFNETAATYRFIDNSAGNTADAYSGLRSMLHNAGTPYVILCHQDVQLIDGLDTLLDRLRALTELDGSWALAGNAGGRADGSGLAIRITDPHGADQRRGGPFPAAVNSLDENFIIVRRDTGVTFSADLHGFHMYGADICAVANVLGFTSYVIDFHLHHYSAGALGPSFWTSKSAFERKWSRVARARTINTTCTCAHVNGGVGVAAWHTLKALIYDARKALKSYGKSRDQR